MTFFQDKNTLFLTLFQISFPQKTACPFPEKKGTECLASKTSCQGRWGGMLCFSRLSVRRIEHFAFRKGMMRDCRQNRSGNDAYVSKNGHAAKDGKQEHGHGNLDAALEEIRAQDVVRAGNDDHAPGNEQKPLPHGLGHHDIHLNLSA